jgi:hypothetical protein
MVLVNAICVTCAARDDLVDRSLEKLAEVYPGLKVLDPAAVHLSGGAA